MKKLIYSAALMALVVTGCRKEYLETSPSNGVTEQQIFSDVATIYATLDGVVKENFAYGVGATATRHDAFGQKAYDLSMDLMGNDMVVHAQGYGWFNTAYNLTEFQSANANRQSDLAWYIYYDMIGQANKILANIPGLNSTQAVKDAIEGEVKGIRAYCYYYLINLFQQTYKGHENSPGVPVYTVPATEGKPRGTVQMVYDQILADLNDAEILLAGKPRVDKSHIDVNTVQAFKARVALLMEDWATAATKANAARQGYGLMTQTEYATRGSFAMLSNVEAIWGAIIPAAEATILASFWSHMDVGVGGYARLGPQQKKITKDLYDMIPSGDVRKSVFVAPGTGTAPYVDYTQNKLTVPVTTSWEGDYIYIRSSEMYLIEAEALARQGQDAAARSVLEQLVQARFPAYSAGSLSGGALLSEILLQRRIELWGEGFSLIDIKRLNQGLNRPTGPGNHGAPSFDPGVYTTPPADPRFIMRIPLRELDNNPAMTPADQNP